MSGTFRQDDWETPQAADGAQRMADAIDSLEQIANALKTSGAGYKLTLVNYADDTAAATGGVQIGQLYRTGSAVKVRVT